ERARHTELLHQRSLFDVQIGEMKRRQRGLQSQLRGHVFLDLVWGPWNRVRKIEAELDELPVVAGFPEDGLARLGKLNEELETATHCRDALLKEAAQLRKQADELDIDPEMRKHASTVQSFLDQRE